MTNEQVLGVIPARYGSTRFPGKPLADILGKSMIQRVYEQVLKSKLISKVIVATDDERIFSAVEKFGGNVENTPVDINNGSERVAVVAQKYNFPIVVNIQGDEPLISPQSIDNAIQLLIDDHSVSVGTLVKKIEHSAELVNPNIPKVVIDKNSYAIYFSRSIIPFNRDLENSNDWLQNHCYFKHIGLYAYRTKFLLKYVQMPVSSLEQTEKLEQLRILENGFRIKVAAVNYAPQSVDTPEDLQKIIAHLKENPVE